MAISENHCLLYYIILYYIILYYIILYSEVGRVPKDCTQVKVKVLLEIITQVNVIV